MRWPRRWREATALLPPRFSVMNQPKVQTDDPPPEGASPDHNPTGETPHGIPKGTEDHDAKALPNDDRKTGETAPQTIDKS